MSRHEFQLNSERYLAFLFRRVTEELDILPEKLYYLLRLYGQKNPQVDIGEIGRAIGRHSLTWDQFMHLLAAVGVRIRGRRQAIEQGGWLYHDYCMYE